MAGDSRPRKLWVVLSALSALVLATAGIAVADDLGPPTDEEAAAAVSLLDEYVRNRPTTTVTVTRSPQGTPTPTDTPTATGRRWYSGVGADMSNPVGQDGSFGTWRGEPITMGGGWDDTLDAQTGQWSTSDGAWKKWSGPYDIAVGAIYKEEGQSWSAAASGTYNSRWTTALKALKKAWGDRGPENLYIRFAHEMNGSWSDWNVKSGEEKNFRAALTQFSSLRYQVFGEDNAPALVLCANDGTSSGYADPRSLFVAKDDQGRPVVDLYSVDTYNSWPHRTDKAAIVKALSKTEDGVPVGVEAHRKYAESVGVPFSVGEWGNCGLDTDKCDGGGGESPAYMEAMNEWFRAHAGDPEHPEPGQLVYELYFNLWDQYELHPDTGQPTSAKAYRNLVWGQ
ncbi:MAG: hypothetical protein QG608_2986 [Actinomycetota bacterium]|nr:hypothetical protein [Actinomycetota bacterium]